MVEVRELVSVKPLEWCETIYSPELRGGHHAYAGSIFHDNYKAWGDGTWAGPGGFNSRSGGTLETAKAACQADYESRILSVLSPASVKPLEWKANGSTSIWTGELMFGVYYVIYDEGDGFRVFGGQVLSAGGDTPIAFCRDQDEAKAACQADYERRILSALTVKETANAD